MSAVDYAVAEIVTGPRLNALLDGLDSRLLGSR
jgi:hypothetical protein